MNEKNDFALVSRPPGALEKTEPGTKRILALMVAETLGLAGALLSPKQFEDGERRYRASGDNVVPAKPALDPFAKAAAMADLRARALVCEKCPHLVRSRRQVVFGVGNVNADLMFVGEAPGMDEDRQGEPSVGRAGQLLTKIIMAMGLTRQDVYIGNILKCRPDTPNQTYGNRKPTMEEMETCIPWLLEQIAIIQPKVLVGLGATAIERLTGSKVVITRMRGQWQSFQGIPLMPTFHPSYLLHAEDNPAANFQQKRLVWEDLIQVMEKLSMPISENQRNYFLTK